MAPSVYVIATADTKSEDLRFVADEIRHHGLNSVTVDVSTGRDVETGLWTATREQIASAHPQGLAAVLGKSQRSEAIDAMSVALRHWLCAEHERGRVAGVIGLGGSGGSALIAPALQSLPVGLPKMLISTMASGNAAPYVGCSDIMLLYPVVDIAGINVVSRQVLANAAAAIAGMIKRPVSSASDRPAVGVTMFGVTTPCVMRVRDQLRKRELDPLVFHATGSGGRAMEKLVESRLLSAVMDLTTTEVADEIVGGVFPAGPKRMDIIVERKIPYVVSVGALDMVNFGARASVPPQFSERRLHVHNAQVTLMRTTPEENSAAGAWIANKLSQAVAPVTVVLTEGGVSALDAPGQPFWHPDANHALFESLEAGLRNHPWVSVRRVPGHINDPEVADYMIQCLDELR